MDCGEDKGTHGENVSTDDRCFVGWREEGVFGDANVDGFKAALIEWYIFGDEAAETVDYSGEGDGFGGVGVAWFFV